MSPVHLRHVWSMPTCARPKSALTTLRAALASLYQPPCSTCDIDDPVCHSSIFPLREYAEAGGLMSYGEKIANQWRRVGVYVDRVLNGEKNLPVEQAVKFEFVINIQTARVFNLAIPSGLLAIADEVIE